MLGDPALHLGAQHRQADGTVGQHHVVETADVEPGSQAALGLVLPLVLPTADFDPLQPGKSESKILRVVALESNHCVPICNPRFVTSAGERAG